MKLLPRESSNAREGIKTGALLRLARGWSIRRESSNAREGIKTNLTGTLLQDANLAEGIIERPRGH